MYAGIEVVVFAFETMSIAAGAVVALDEQYRFSCLGQQRRGTQAADAGTDHDNVVTLLFGFLVYAAHGIE